MCAQTKEGMRCQDTKTGRPEKEVRRGKEKCVKEKKMKRRTKGRGQEWMKPKAYVSAPHEGGRGRERRARTGSTEP